MTAPEPLRLTLEEAMRAVHWKRLKALREKHGYLADVQMEITETGWCVFLNEDGKQDNQFKEFTRWEDAASFALGVPVAARNEATELRAALEALAGSYVTNKVPHDNLWHMLVRTEVLERARAALAAPEGSE